MKLNRKGKELVEHWNNIWSEEVERREKAGQWVDGFCMLENAGFIKSVEDAVGWYISGYADGDGWCEAFVDFMDTWGAKYPEFQTERVREWIDCTYPQFVEELKKYFVFDQEEYDEFLKDYGIEPW